MNWLQNLSIFPQDGSSQELIQQQQQQQRQLQQFLQQQLQQQQIQQFLKFLEEHHQQQISLTPPLSTSNVNPTENLEKTLDTSEAEEEQIHLNETTEDKPVEQDETATNMESRPRKRPRNDLDPEFLATQNTQAILSKKIQIQQRTSIDNLCLHYTNLSKVNIAL